ncbi:MAG: glycosyltransferase [Stellaceae bacterium]
MVITRPGPLRVDILAFGSRGDVQPYVALGLGLRASGHKVRLVTLRGFEEFVRGHGLDQISIAPAPREIAATAAGQDWIRQRDKPNRFRRGFVRVVRALVEDSIANYWRVCGDVEALIASASGLLLAVHIAQKMGVPLIRAQYDPSAPTRYDWNGRTSLAIAARGAWWAFAGAAFRFLLWQGLRGPTNRARSQLLGLPPLRMQDPFTTLNRLRVPLLDGYSPVVVPRPPDWGDWIHVTGYWFLDTASDWLPPPGLVDFLQSGPPPVFVGFGSVPLPNPEATAGLVLRALSRAGRRGVLVAGGSRLASGLLADGVFAVDAVPYDWLFSRVCAAVHQGGAGVTAAALRAGLPSVVVPVFGDHPFWAQRVFQLGAGPRPVPARRLTEDALADAIQATAGSEMRHRAAALGAQIRKEDGVARAVELFHEHVGALH